MKKMFVLFLLSVFSGFGTHLFATTLPDACGDDKVQFDVTMAKNAPAPAALADGKARIVFIERIDTNGLCIGCNYTARVGMDGAWVGANKGNSYFVLDVAPGEHHVCADWQSAIGKRRAQVGMGSLTAEAGKVYYYQIHIKATPGEVSGMPNGPVTSTDVWTLDLAPLSDDEGKYRMKISALANAKPKK